LAADDQSRSAAGTAGRGAVLARHFRSLWVVAGMADALELALTPLFDAGWEKGWLAVRQTLRFDSAGMPERLLERLLALSARAEPKTFVGRVKAVVLNGNSLDIDFIDGEKSSDAYQRAEDMARELGIAATKDVAALDALLPLVVSNVQGRQWMFGLGLAEGAPLIDDCWRALIEAFESLPEDRRSLQVLRGFLLGLSKRDKFAFDRILDEAIQRPSLVKWVPILQLSAPLDEAGNARLLTSMDNPVVPAWVFQYLSLGRTTQDLPDDVIATLLSRLAIKPDGLAVVVEILAMHVHDNPDAPGPRVTELAQRLLTGLPLSHNTHQMDHSLQCIVDAFFRGSEGESCARTLLISVRRGIENYTLSSYDHPEMLKAIFRVQPRAALEILVGDDPDEGNAYMRRRGLAGGYRSSALSDVPLSILLAWCREGPESRWAALAPLLPAFAPANDAGAPRWSSYVVDMLKEAPHPVDVAESLVGLIQPSSWSGSSSEAIRRRLPLLDELASLLGPDHASKVASWRLAIDKTIEAEERRDLAEHRATNERFE
jgi:hypothetical protein